MIGGKFAPLTIMNNEDADMHSLVTTFDSAVTETASVSNICHWQTLRKEKKEKKTHPGSLYIFLICGTEGENSERKYSNLKDLRNTRK